LKENNGCFFLTLVGFVGVLGGWILGFEGVVQILVQKLLRFLQALV
jgi:hypothetical protein